MDDEKVKKGKKERDELYKERKKEVQKRMAREEERDSWKKKAIGIGALICLCGAGFAQFLFTILDAMRGTGITNVDVADTAALKTVLFSGEPWLVYCVSNETTSQRLPRVLEDGARTLSSNLGLNTAVVQCWQPTASGRSVAQRFKLNLKPPLSFVVANGNKPRTINLVGISKVEELEKRIKPALKVETHKIDTLKKWPSLCTSRRTCVVIGHKNGAQRDAGLTVFKPLLEKHRGVKVVTLDTSFWQLKLDEKVLAKRTPGSKKGAQVFCLARDEAPAGSSGNGTYSGTFLDELDASSASSFMSACEARRDLATIDTVPKINARPSKPKKASPSPPPPSSRPKPPPSPPKEKKAKSVDRVGSRESLVDEDPLFEAVDEDEDGGDEDDGDDEGEDMDDEDASSGDDEDEVEL